MKKIKTAFTKKPLTILALASALLQGVIAAANEPVPIGGVAVLTCQSNNERNEAVQSTVFFNSNHQEAIIMIQNQGITFVTEGKVHFYEGMPHTRRAGMIVIGITLAQQGGRMSVDLSYPEHKNGSGWSQLNIGNLKAESGLNCKFSS